MPARASGASVDVDPERGASDGFAAASSTSASAGIAAGGKDSPKDSSAIGLAAGAPDANAAPAGGSGAADATPAAASGITGSTIKWRRCSGLGVFTAPVLWVAAQLQAILAWIWLQCEPQWAWIGHKFKPVKDVLCYHRSYLAVFEDHRYFTGAGDGADPRDFLKDLWSAYAVVVSQLGRGCLWPGSQLSMTWRHVSCGSLQYVLQLCCLASVELIPTPPMCASNHNDASCSSLCTSSFQSQSDVQTLLDMHMRRTP